MSKYESFEELKEECKTFVDAAKKRGAYDGIKKLLTELYPDRAHFIYELLQNAEDMWASEVIFKLTNDTLIFEHNGKKRDFSLEDISAITNVGQSPKRDDPTSIGQFGVGFKAVYAYTRTPEIHSGKFDFKIIDMLMPEDVGVKKCARLGYTQFIFPLGTDTKDTSAALREIENGLRALDENSILFLSHIKKIWYQLSNSAIGSITNSKDENAIDDHVQKVVVYRPNSSTPSISYFLKFDKEVYVKIKEQTETRSVSIAYRMLKTDTKFVFDPSLHGKVCIYFPAEKESNTLRFHINAPFASTVARDSVRDSSENNNLIDHISNLVCESIDWIKAHNLWDRSIYAVLPHSRDFIANANSIVEKIQRKVKHKFLTCQLIQIKQQLFVAPKDCVQLGRAIANIFSQEDFMELEGHNYILAAQPYSSALPATNEIHFFTDLSIGVINENRFIRLLKDTPQTVSSIVITKPIDWICNFFALLYDIWQNNQYDATELRRIVMIPTENDIFCQSSDIYFKSSYSPNNIKNPNYVHQTVAGNKKAHDFLAQVLKVPTMSETEDHLEEIRAGDSESAISGMVGILKEFSETSNKEVFRRKYCDEPIFLARSSYNKMILRPLKASECCWSSAVAPFYGHEELVPYLTNDGLRRYKRVKCANILALNEYEKGLNPEEIKQLKNLFVILGGNASPKIITFDAEQNPLCKQWIETHKFRRTNTTKIDYTITGLESVDEIVENNSIDSILLLWKLVSADNLSDHILFGTFYPSENGAYWRGESALVYQLKRKRWVPNRYGNYLRPCEINEKDLPDDFVFTTMTPLLKAIGFGNKAQKSKETLAKINIVAPDANEEQKRVMAMILENPELAADFLIHQETREKERLGLLEALGQQTKLQSGDNEEDLFEQRIGISNPEKRQKKLQEIFESGLQAPHKRTRGIRFTYSTSVSKEEKVFIYHQYKGTCQICGQSAIKKHDGNPYFITINIIGTNHLKDELLTNIGQGWNTLCVCPNCAAKYKYCAKNLDTFADQVFNKAVEAKSEEYIIITIELQGQLTEIKFTPAHFLALQAAFKTYVNNVDD